MSERAWVWLPRRGLPGLPSHPQSPPQPLRGVHLKGQPIHRRRTQRVPLCLFTTLVTQLPRSTMLCNVLLRDPRLLFLRLASFFPSLYVRRVLFRPLMSLGVNVQLQEYRVEYRHERRFEVGQEGGERVFLDLHRFI